MCQETYITPKKECKKCEHQENYGGDKYRRVCYFDVHNARKIKITESELKNFNSDKYKPCKLLKKKK